MLITASSYGNPMLDYCQVGAQSASAGSVFVTGALVGSTHLRFSSDWVVDWSRDSADLKAINAIRARFCSDLVDGLRTDTALPGSSSRRPPGQKQKQKQRGGGGGHVKSEDEDVYEMFKALHESLVEKHTNRKAVLMDPANASRCMPASFGWHALRGGGVHSDGTTESMDQVLEPLRPFAALEPPPPEQFYQNNNDDWYDEDEDEDEEQYDEYMPQVDEDFL